MIRQLQRLTRPLLFAHPATLAIATYAEPSGDALRHRAAAEQGFEGVACIDDSARAAILYCNIWQSGRHPWARETATDLLRFVTQMQGADGRFANFVLDWSGRPNLTGPTSRPGGPAWTARAMHALARGVAVLGDTDLAAHFERGLPWLDQPAPYLDVRAVAVLAALEYWQATGHRATGDRALRWAEEIAASFSLGRLPNALGVAEVHLWGHLQEVALARAGVAFGRPEFTRLARASVETVFVPVVERGFPQRRVLPFDVSCAVLALDAVAEASGEQRYARLAMMARQWFDGRNPAGRPVYDRVYGRVYDGIDAGRVSANSGAESNIEGGFALFDSIPWDVYARQLQPA